MNHDEATRLAGPYRDGELDLASSLAFEEHLAGCADCQRLLAGEEALDALLHASSLRHAAPPALKARVRAALRSAEAPAPWWRRWALRPVYPALAGAAAAAIAVAALWTPGLSEIDREAMADHVRSLQAAHLMDVVSTDRHTVKPWFAGKLDYSPPVVDPAADGYPLIGGRLDVLGGRDVAALVYQRRKHAINLFVWPSQDAAPASGLRARNGYRLLGWSAGGMNYLAVSELGEGEMREFAGLIRDRNADARPGQ